MVDEDDLFNEEDNAVEEAESNVEESVEQAPVSQVESTESLTPEQEKVLAELHQIEALAEMDGRIKESDEYKNLVSLAEKLKGDLVEEEVVEEEEEEVNTEEDDDEVDSDDVDNEPSNPFGLGKGTEQLEELEFEIEPEMEDFIKSHYGLEDVSSFFEKVDTWRNQAQDGAETNRKYDELIDGIQELPTEIKSAIQAFSNAEDYRAAFNNSGGNLNFDAEYEDQDKNALVSNYFSDELKSIQKELDDGNIDDSDYDKQVELLYKSSKKLFTSDKKMVVNKRAEIMREQKQQQEVFKGSVISSVDRLRKEFPNFGKKDLQKIQQRLVNEDIESLFYNKDGSYKEEAAEMLAYSMYGKQVIQSLLNEASKDGETKANSEIVKRGSKKPRATKTQRQQRTEAMDAINHLQGQFTRNPYE